MQTPFGVMQTQQAAVSGWPISTIFRPLLVHRCKLKVPGLTPCKVCPACNGSGVDPSSLCGSCGGKAHDRMSRVGRSWRSWQGTTPARQEVTVKVRIHNIRFLF